ncbi:TetR/AcrR family transcriptional regulator [Massilia sp. TSP1-1-2]|uniref:TetR/AcrR family transcriptional regulator n=1 Tax=unclassified Massilia TaxID=2609279 RepID=UPI003CFA6574
MNRPSKQVDAQLIASGLALLPQTGCGGLSVRKLVEHAGVNLGMFHYHFKNKDNFIRILLDQMYEGMFLELQLQTAARGDAVASLRAAITVLGRFVLKHRAMLGMLLAEAARGEPVPLAFLRNNAPRHVHVLLKLVRQGQADGNIIGLPVQQLLPFIAGGVIAPMLAGNAAERSGAIDAGMAALVDVALLSEQALLQRIELSLRAITLIKEAP